MDLSDHAHPNGFGLFDYTLPNDVVVKVTTIDHEGSPHDEFFHVWGLSCKTCGYVEPDESGLAGGASPTTGPETGWMKKDISTFTIGQDQSESRKHVVDFRSEKFKKN